MLRKRRQDRRTPKNACARSMWLSGCRGGAQRAPPLLVIRRRPLTMGMHTGEDGHAHWGQPEMAVPLNRLDRHSVLRNSDSDVLPLKMGRRTADSQKWVSCLFCGLFCGGG